MVTYILNVQFLFNGKLSPETGQLLPFGLVLADTYGQFVDGWTTVGTGKTGLLLRLISWYILSYVCRDCRKKWRYKIATKRTTG